MRSLEDDLSMVNWFISEASGSEPPPQFVKGGKVRLHHFSKASSDTLIIDPQKFITNRGYYSRNDWQRSGKPRSFWYLDPGEKENIISATNHYIVDYDAGKIYNLLRDPLGLKEKSEYARRIQFDKLFRLVEEAGFHGVYYKPGFHVVNLFVKVKAKKAAPVAVEWLTRRPLKLVRESWDRVVIKKSSNPKKKLMAIFRDSESNKTKTTHFGATGYSDFTKHKDTERRKRYDDRHRSSENWSDPTTAGALSKWILWNKESRRASIADFKRRFKLK